MLKQAYQYLLNVKVNKMANCTQRAVLQYFDGSLRWQELISTDRFLFQEDGLVTEEEINRNFFLIFSFIEDIIWWKLANK